MTLATYSNLKTQIASFLNRDDLASHIDAFIDLAEAKINRDVRHWKMEKRSIATFDEGYESLPSDWIETVRLSKENGKEIKRVSNADMMRMKAASDGLSGDPLYYTLIAKRIELYPAPASNFAAELVYLGKVDALSDAETTNWLLEDAPDVYLYGALMHTAPWLKEDERLQVWSGLYLSAVQDLNNTGKASEFSGPLRIRIR